METRKKIKLIIPTDEIHREIFKLKADKGFKNANDVLKFLLDIYNKYKIKLEMEKEEHIQNSNNQVNEDIGNIYKT